MDASVFTVDDDDLTFAELYQKLPQDVQALINVSHVVGRHTAHLVMLVIALGGCAAAFALMLMWVCLFWLQTQLLLKLAALLRICYEHPKPVSDDSANSIESSHEGEESRDEQADGSPEKRPPQERQNRSSSPTGEELDLFDALLNSPNESRQTSYFHQSQVKESGQALDLHEMGVPNTPKQVAETTPNDGISAPSLSEASLRTTHRPSQSVVDGSEKSTQASNDTSQRPALGIPHHAPATTPAPISRFTPDQLKEASSFLHDVSKGRLQNQNVIRRGFATGSGRQPAWVQQPRPYASVSGSQTLPHHCMQEPSTQSKLTIAKSVSSGAPSSTLSLSTPLAPHLRAQMGAKATKAADTSSAVSADENKSVGKVFNVPKTAYNASSSDRLSFDKLSQMDPLERSKAIVAIINDTHQGTIVTPRTPHRVEVNKSLTAGDSAKIEKSRNLLKSFDSPTRPSKVEAQEELLSPKCIRCDRYIRPSLVVLRNFSSNKALCFPCETVDDRINDAKQLILSTPGKSSTREDRNARIIFVGNVNHQASEKNLHTHFQSFGPINHLHLAVSKFTGEPRGFAHIEFSEVKAAATALKLNKSRFFGRTITVAPKGVEMADVRSESNEPSQGSDVHGSTNSNENTPTKAAGAGNNEKRPQSSNTEPKTIEPIVKQPLVKEQTVKVPTITKITPIEIKTAQKDSSPKPSALINGVHPDLEGLVFGVSLPDSPPPRTPTPKEQTSTLKPDAHPFFVPSSKPEAGKVAVNAPPKLPLNVASWAPPTSALPLRVPGTSAFAPQLNANTNTYTSAYMNPYASTNIIAHQHSAPQFNWNAFQQQINELPYAQHSHGYAGTEYMPVQPGFGPMRFGAGYGIQPQMSLLIAVNDMQLGRPQHARSASALPQRRSASHAVPIVRPSTPQDDTINIRSEKEFPSLQTPDKPMPPTTLKPPPGLGQAQSTSLKVFDDMVLPNRSQSDTTSRLIQGQESVNPQFATPPTSKPPYMEELEAFRKDFALKQKSASFQEAEQKQTTVSPPANSPDRRDSVLLDQRFLTGMAGSKALNAADANGGRFKELLASEEDEESHLTLDDVGTEAEADETVDESFENASTVDLETANTGTSNKKKKRATRAALTTAWEEREAIRQRVVATYTLDGMRALEDKTKTYNNKRSELAVLMAGGELVGEDARVFPRIGKADMSEPKVKPAGARGASIINKLDPVMLTEDSASTLTESKLEDDRMRLSREAIQARRNYEEAHEYFNRPPPQGRANIKDLRAKGETRLSLAAKRYEQKCTALRAVYPDGYPPWLEAEIWKFDDVKRKAIRDATIEPVHNKRLEFFKVH